MFVQHQKLYDQLRVYYQLLYLFDIQKYKPDDLKSLASRLQAQMSLDPQEKIIHEELIATSKQNVKNKLSQKREREEEKKREKQQLYTPKDTHLNIKPPSQPIAPQRNFKKEDKQHRKKIEQQHQAFDYIEQSCIIDSFPYQPNYRELKTVEGKIYDGRLIVTLEAANLQNTAKKPLFFQIISEVEESTMTLEALKQLCLSPNSWGGEVLVGGKRVSARVGERQYCSLGWKYLRESRVVVRCNFRAEYSTFSLIFTQ